MPEGAMHQFVCVVCACACACTCVCVCVGGGGIFSTIPSDHIMNLDRKGEWFPLSFILQDRIKKHFY